MKTLRFAINRMVRGRHHPRIPNAIIPALAALSVLLLAPTATAQLLGVSSVRVSVAPRLSDGTSNTFATLDQAKDGTLSLVVRSFDRRTGFQQGTPFLGLLLPAVQKPRFKDVLVSTVYEPGSVLALDSDRRVHVYPLDFLPDGTPFLAAPKRIIGPLGPPDAGEATALGEAPNPSNPGDPLLGIGTKTGHVILSNSRFGDGSVRLSTGEIQDLGPIAQAGYFAFGAVSGGLLHLAGRENDLDARVTAVLRDPRRIPLIDFGSPLLTRESEPFIDPNVNLIVTANGTTEIATLEIPPNPGIGDIMTVRIIDPICCPVKQVVFGSLTSLQFDGAGVCYNAGFTREDGIAGRTWTIAGASMGVAPETLKLARRGRFVTVRIEAENHRAADIDVTTLSLSVDGARGAVPVSVHPRPRLLHFDGDLNIDLEARFDRAALIDLLGQTSGRRAIVRASWQYTDGTDGTTSAQVKVKR